ncbi:hypothetical protein ATE92_0724 [Ulvibacter sp. MAR_2010_11]|uniref:hypothetical protein n=1 Tax=Ulvibacter sp. MAR_2010_11 TaxID=1250229 RepID=UPI000C2CB8B7|nr:hypothetical protein [Ulvibacter sp. MAR_2010_11]PKA82591.1 hypothetical protein ATE92_0724 [Ulvibacter sp. MAR_2010_11]
MKYLHSLCAILLLLTVGITHAQQQYTVEGKTYTLQTEIEGTLTLLWNTIDDEYRYFVKKGSAITELKNTKVDGDYKEEYKETLTLLTSDAPVSTDKLKLTLSGLRNYVVEYNRKADSNFVYEKPSVQLKTRLGVFAGMTNNAYFYNPNNDFLPALGIDFEIIDEVRLKRHAVVFQFKQVLENSDYKFSSSQVSFNYRFKFIKSEKFDAFVTAKAATFTSVSRDQELIDGEEVTKFTSGSQFQVPGAFGFGFDYALGNGYLSLVYHDIVAVTIDNNGNTPVDISLGYKLNL